MGRCCAVHGCVSGRKASKSVRKVALFKAPKDVEMCNKWSSALGQELKSTSFICELHFNPEDVIKSDRGILKDGRIYVYEYQKKRVHLKKKAEPKSNFINDSNDNEIQKVHLRKKAEPKSNIINDSNGNEYQKVHLRKKAKPKSNIINGSNDKEYIMKVHLKKILHVSIHLKKKAEPKSNIINDSNDNNNSLLSDNEFPNTSDISDHTLIGDCSLNSVETSTVNEIKNEVIEPENTNSANTNCPHGANTATENDNFLIINETAEFSFCSIKKILESQPLRKNWSWTVIKNSFITLSYISSKLELVCHVKIDMDLKVTIINAKTNIIIDMNVNISSIACIWQLLKSLENSFFCSGTGYDDKKCSVTCTGILLPGESYKRRVVEYRCITCRKLRRLIQKRKTETLKNNEAQWMNFKHRYILQRRKLNRAVHTNKKLKQQLLDLKNQCAEINEEVLFEKIADLPALQQESLFIII